MESRHYLYNPCAFLFWEIPSCEIDAILDRLPTAQILDETDGEYIVNAEVFGKGIDMWLKSQGESVKVISEVIE